MYLCDYHVHTKISPDSAVAAEEMAQRALELGLSEICLTDHFDVSAEKLPGYEHFDFDAKAMNEQYQKAKSKYEGKLKIKLGIELGQPHHIPEMAKGLMQSNSFDFVLCSLHNRKNFTDYFFVDFTKVNPVKELEKFFEDMLQMVSYDDYDVIAHLPYPMRYIAKTFGSCNLEPFGDVLEKILKIIIQNGKGIEINTSTLRQMDFTMPPLWIAKLYKELGGEIITVGSDAHNPLHLGYGLTELRRELKAFGFEYLTIYSERKPEFIKMA